MNFNQDVSDMLDKITHPLRTEIELLRLIILEACDELEENIKWNGPNYYDQDNDRITMKIQPPSKIQLIFHRGAKKLPQPANKLVNDSSGLLLWKENDRAVMTFTNLAEIETQKKAISYIVEDWINACK